MVTHIAEARPREARPDPGRSFAVQIPQPQESGSRPVWAAVILKFSLLDAASHNVAYKLQIVKPVSIYTIEDTEKFPSLRLRDGIF